MRLWMLSLLLLTACRLAPRGVWVERGEDGLSAIDRSLREAGGYFHPFLPDDVDDNLCAQRGNQAVKNALEARYRLLPAPAGESGAAPGQPRYRVEVVGASCQAVHTGSPSNNASYAMKGKAKETRGEVRIVIRDATSGDEVAALLGRETMGDGFAAVQQAGQAAVTRIYAGKS